MQYVWVRNCSQHGLENEGAANSNFNLFDSAMWFSGAHGDFIQAYSSNSIAEFNTFYQPAANGQGFPGGVVAAWNTSLPNNNQTIANVVFNNNTGVGVGATGHSSGPQAMENWINWSPTGTGDTIQSPVAQDNYVTMSGNRSSDFGFDEANGFGTFPNIASPTLLNNLNMETGLQLPSLPVISSIASSTATTTATITWNTDVLASSKVAYGTTTSYGSATSSATLVTSHSIGITGLSSGTTYHYEVVSINSFGNTSTSTDYTFTTATSSTPDTTPPSSPTNLTAVASSSSEIDLSWTASTDNVGVAGYKILRGGAYVGTTTSGTTFADTGLTASTTYTYVVKAFDAAGNISPSSNTANATTSGSSSYSGPGNIASGAIAWWGLRAYNVAYATGSDPAADILRASDSATTTINILSNGNFDTATAVSFCASTTCTVTKLYDQTGNGNNTTAVAAPVALTFNCIGSLPCMNFNGTSHFLASPGGSNIPQPWTISAVAERTGAFTSFGSIYGDTSNEQLMFTTSPNTVSVFGGVLLPGAATDSAFHALQGIANGASSNLYIDGTANSGSAGTNAFVATGATIGNGFNTLTGNMTEVGIWPSAFSTSTATNLSSNQHTYWGF